MIHIIAFWAVKGKRLYHFSTMEKLVGSNPEYDSLYLKLFLNGIELI